MFGSDRLVLYSKQAWDVMRKPRKTPERKGKWPKSFLGDILTNLRRRGLIRTLKYVWVLI